MTQDDLRAHAEGIALAARALRDAARAAEADGCTVDLSFDTHDYPNAFLSVYCEARFDSVARAAYWRALLLDLPAPPDDLISEPGR